MRNFIKDLKTLIKPYVLLETVGLLVTLISTSAIVAIPIISGLLIDKATKVTDVSSFTYILIIFLIATLMQPILGYVRDCIFINITEGLTFDIRKKMLNNITNSPMSFFDKKTKGEVISRVVNDGRGISSFLSSFFVVFIKDFFLILAIIVAMFIKSPSLTIMIIVVFLLYIPVHLFFSRKLQFISGRIQKNYDGLCTHISQLCESIVTIKSYGNEANVEQEGETIIKAIYKDNKNILILNSLINTLSGVVIALSLAAIYGIGILFVVKKQMAVGDIIAVGLLFQNLLMPIYEALNTNMSYETTKPIFERVKEYLDLKNEVLGFSAGVKLNKGIDIENLSFSYDGSTEVLKNLSVNLPANGVIGICGGSGSGKTTFVKLLLKLYEAQQGKIEFVGYPQFTPSTKDIRENLCYVAQDSEILNSSVLDNLTYGNKNVNREAIEDITKKLNLYDKILSLPQGFDTIISERVNLSGGEKQRLCIARALIKNSPIYIFDEPTSALDESNKKIINDLILELGKEKLILMISHENTSFELADKILYFKENSIEVSPN